MYSFFVKSIGNKPLSSFIDGLHFDNNKETISILFCLQAQ